MKKSNCPKCNSKNLSDGKRDFLVVDGFEKLFQFCYDCHAEWFVKQDNDGGKD